MDYFYIEFLFLYIFYYFYVFVVFYSGGEYEFVQALFSIRR